jgi:dolichol-phosphate mannosyltransferase
VVSACQTRLDGMPFQPGECPLRCNAMKTVIMVPTYNETLNLHELVERLHQSVPSAVVLIVDDSSPDGTSDLVRDMKRTDDRLELLSRPREQKGRGWAGRDGFVEAIRLGAEAVVEMDADLSHPPEVIPAMLLPLEKNEADAVIASRFVAGGADEDRSRARQWVSIGARAYLRIVLGVRTQDPTSGFRAYSRSALERIDVASLTARDPFTVTEILYRCHRAGLRIAEVPYSFVDRKKGESKLQPGTLLKYLARVVALRLAD